MQIVIDIPEEDYEYLKLHNKDGLYNAILNGKPLPKGHGRLIDGDSLKNCFRYAKANTNNENDMIMTARRIIKSAPTIIEADKESTEPHECNTCKFGKNYENGYDATTMNDECGGCCSWNDKWQPKESEGKE